MKNKKIIIIFNSIILCWVVLSSSCEDMMGNYLDKAPGVDVTLDTIFSSQRNAETFVVNMYKEGMHSDLPRWDDYDGKRDAIYACTTDEAENAASWYWCHNFNNASQNPNWNGDDGRRKIRWRAIRNTNILLERIDGVPNAEPDFIKQAAGQARFIRALNYFEMLKRYGGMPIVRKSLDATDDLLIPRATFSEMVDFIVGDCDTAAMQLPDKWSDTFIGKATKGAALMLKSRTLLYAASPLFNASKPYIDLPGNNEIPTYGNYDINRWKKAADAAKAVIDWAPSGSIALVTDQGVTKNYKYVWEVPDNQEIILSVKHVGMESIWFMAFKSINNFYITEAGTSVTFNFVKKYEKLNGTPQTWNQNGGDDLNQKYAELDPRFAQSIAYNGSYWNADFPSLKMFQGEGEVASSQPPRIGCKGGHWLMKWIPSNLTASTNGFANWYLYRLAEAYLNYAEAINEFEGPTQEAYNAVNIIRQRSGMPDFPPGLSQEEFRKKLRNERAIEFAFEEHRLWDIYRWMIAEEEGVMRGNMWGINIYRIGSTDEYRYEPYVFETRTFNRNMYLHPIMQNEINKGYMIQNPGW